MTHKSVPDFASPRSLADYPPGVRVATTDPAEWSGLSLSIFELVSEQETFSMPAISEPMLVWVVSGSAETGERDHPGQPWNVHAIASGSLFLTAAGAPYQFYWKRQSDAPFEVVMAVLDDALFQRALGEVFGPGTTLDNVSIKDLSGFDDPVVVALLSLLRTETLARAAQRGFIQGLVQALAVHVARRYCLFSATRLPRVAMLHTAKLRRAKEWLEHHVSDAFNLSRLAQEAHMSEFHFTRLFRNAVGMPPSRYHARLRIDQAKQLLRESTLSVLQIGNEVGYANPSHFARVFKQQTGQTPRAYRSLPVSSQQTR